MTTTTPHTPGPWTVNICNENGPFLDSFYISTAAQTWDGNEEERIVCRFPTGTGQFSDMGRENLANARLIAAAPALLEQLTHAVDILTALETLGWPGLAISAGQGNSDVLRFCRAAIDQAQKDQP